MDSASSLAASRAVSDARGATTTCSNSMVAGRVPSSPARSLKKARISASVTGGGRRSRCSRHVLSLEHPPPDTALGGPPVLLQRHALPAERLLQGGAATEPALLLRHGRVHL
jgi:hypothetical protein